jgi:cell division protein FtsI (penicillin-binding protein 3)
MAKASDIIGSERFYRMARSFGFGSKTYIEYPGEVQGTLSKPSTWSGLTLNSMAYGYEVQATALQITSAYCAVANHGILMKPMIFLSETDANGEVVRENHPEQIRQVISEETCETLKKFFVGVVEHGTGKLAKIPGMKIAGKTGTSKRLVNGAYVPGSYRGSFVGFFPVDDPRLVCFIMMDNLSGTEYYGGTTSAPVFRSIAEQIINTSEMFAPQTARHDVPSGTHNSSGEGSSKQPEANLAQSTATIPDVRGFSVRQAVYVLKSGKLTPVVNGTGTVVSENPPAGQPAKAGMLVTLTCQTKSFSSLSGN